MFQQDPPGKSGGKRNLVEMMGAEHEVIVSRGMFLLSPLFSNELRSNHPKEYPE